MIDPTKGMKAATLTNLFILRISLNKINFSLIDNDYIRGTYWMNNAKGDLFFKFRDGELGHYKFFESVLEKIKEDLSS